MEKTRIALKLSATGAAVSGRTVTFKVNGTSVGTAVTNSSGVASRAYTIPSGTTTGSKTLNAAFAGDTACKPCSASSTLVVTTTTATSMYVYNVTAKPGQTVTLRAILARKSDGKAIPGKTVTFKVNGVTIGTATTDAAGVATRAYSIGASAATGTRPIAVTFAGDSTWSPGSASGTLSIVK